MHGSRAIRSFVTFIRIPTRFKTPAFRPEYAPPGPKGQGLRACSGGDANPSTPKATGLKAGDKLVGTTIVRKCELAPVNGAIYFCVTPQAYGTMRINVEFAW
jgi:hypothetical protein